MNILEFIRQGGKCKSAAGHWFHLTDIVEGEQYPIKGTLIHNNEPFKYEWAEDGTPSNLPYTHCLDLVPVIEVIKYKMVDKKELAKYDNIEDFKSACKTD
jgi:hypothetical protein